LTNPVSFSRIRRCTLKTRWIVGLSHGLPSLLPSSRIQLVRWPGFFKGRRVWRAGWSPCLPNLPPSPPSSLGGGAIGGEGAGVRWWRPTCSPEGALRDRHD
jgi:hypothetical protein